MYTLTAHADAVSAIYILMDAEADLVLSAGCVERCEETKLKTMAVGALGERRNAGEATLRITGHGSRAAHSQSSGGPARGGRA